MASAGESEWRKKYKLAIDVQNTLEAELVQCVESARDAKRETQALKARAAADAQELAQVTQQLINSQGQYLQQIGNLSDEVNLWKTRARALEKELEEARLIEPPKAEEPCRKGLETELLKRHEELHDEIKRVTELNERLTEENESLQILVGERTITGELDFGETLDELGDANYEKELEFRLKSAENYNLALKNSLESLVSRLLTDREYESAVEKSIGARRISEFQALLRPGSSPQWTQTPQSRMLKLRPQRRARVFSMGVDEILDDSSDGSTLADTLVIHKRAGTKGQTELRKLSLSD